MFVLIHGAYKNVGDFLIYKNSKSLIEYCTGETDFLELNRKEKLEKHLETINNSKGIFLCGGPAYSADFYPKVSPLISDLSLIKVPIIPLGLGWAGTPKNIQDFKFSDNSLGVIQHIHQNIKFSSVRDVLTKKILNNHGINNVIITGCPVWYDLSYISKPYKLPTKINKIIFTAPAKPTNFNHAKLSAKVISELFPEAEKIITFHRGIEPDKYTGFAYYKLNNRLRLYTEKLGFVSRDVSYSARKVDFYSDYDLHVGYRVHGHLRFLSLRKPSVLISEDGRGLGQAEILGTDNIFAENTNSLEQLRFVLEKHILGGFYGFDKVFKKIDDMFIIMCDFINMFG